MFEAVMRFLIMKIQVFHENPRTESGMQQTNDFCGLQFQGLGKYKTIYVFVTQNMFGNNSRRKLADWFFYCIDIGSL